jgi:hypothetical protein
MFNIQSKQGIAKFKFFTLNKVEFPCTYLFKRSSGKGNAINYVRDILKKRERS